MRSPTYLIVTSISSPNDVLRSLANGAANFGIEFVVVGDTKSPSNFSLDMCRYYSVEAQRTLPLRFPKLCPVKSYSRKNIGYLIALSEGAQIIVETDDDNYPREEFWSQRERLIQAKIAGDSGWINTYRYFSGANIWPRGFPLEEVRRPVPSLVETSILVDSPIQQALADENPDVDAIFRLTQPLPQSFRNEIPVALGANAWCPFNSQNTTWWREAAPLLYLPTHCSFRMTDIWRSFVAQRIAWENDWYLTFHSASVWQERNEHDLLKDFSDEVPGYLANSKIASTLAGLNLKRGASHLFDNLHISYESLVSVGVIGKEEIPLLEAWTNDLREVL